MGRHNQVTPHLARYARHPLPKGEGQVSDFCPHVHPKIWIETSLGRGVRSTRKGVPLSFSLFT
jgi:hypothetical protein